MSLAPASSRGAFLKARLAVNGIQCAARSLGTATGDLVGLLSSMGGLLCVLRALWLLTGYQLHRGGGIQRAVIFPRNRIAQRSEAAIQNTSPSESSVSSQSSGSCG